MVFAISFPSAGAHCGPGFDVQLTGASGPTALDDVFSATLTDATGSTVMTGTAKANGGTVATIIMGMRKGTHADPFGFTVTIATGAAVTLTGQLSSATGTVIATTAGVSCVWDPLMGLGRLIAAEVEQSSVGDVAAILAAVRRDYVSP